MSRVQVEYLCGCSEMVGCELGRETETVRVCGKVLCREHQWKTPTPKLLIITRAPDDQQEQYVRDLQAARENFIHFEVKRCGSVHSDELGACNYCDENSQ